MELVQNSWKGVRTVVSVFGDSFLVAVAISGAVTAAVTVVTLLHHSL
ncbi:MAG: hypothetical protein AAGA38_00315 [Pseudomonadota bacterium]